MFVFIFTVQLYGNFPRSIPMHYSRIHIAFLFLCVVVVPHDLNVKCIGYVDAVSGSGEWCWHTYIEACFGSCS